MSLGITERRVRDVVVLELNGRLTLGAGCEALDKHVEELVTAGRRSILLHCGSVSMIDSQGLKVIVRTTSRLRELGGHLKLCATPPRVHEVFQVTRLVTVLETYPTEAEALASFAPPGPAG